MHILIILFMVLGVIGLAAFAYMFLVGNTASARTGEIRDLMGGASPAERTTKRHGIDPMDLDVETFRKKSSSKVQKKAEDLPRKLFRAGYFSGEDRNRFQRFRVIVFIIAAVCTPIGMAAISGDVLFTTLGVVLGVLIGYAAPISVLEKKIRRREDEIMYFLPLVIEQISIGVSSALDIGPCIVQVISMATERDSHNPVTEMFVHVEKLIRSGLNLEDALAEVSEACGMQDVKHAFMFLGQCSKHGGELSKQLQELADSVMTQRQVQIEGKIASLPVKATGPLTCVFAGFFALLFAGLLVRLLSAFGG